MRPDVSLLLPHLEGGGGLDRTTTRLAAGLTEGGLTVDLVHSDASYPDPFPVPAAVREVDLAADRALRVLPAFARYLRRERPRVIFGAMPVANLTALVARRLAGTDGRVVIKEHLALTELFAADPGPRTRATRALMRRWYPRADGVVCISRGLADELAAVTGLRRERIEVIANPVLPPRDDQHPEPLVSHPWFDGPGPPVIVTVARLSTQKDLPTLLAAVAALRRRRPVRLMILGEGPDRPRTEDTIRRLGLGDDVWLPGFVEHPQRYVARAALFALSSRYEGLGNVLVEALAVGTPVVATDCPHGPREVLGDGRLGTLVPVGDVGSLADAMHRTLERPPAPATPEDLDPYRADRSIARYLDLYHRLVGTPESAGPEGAPPGGTAPGAGRDGAVRG